MRLKTISSLLSITLAASCAGRDVAIAEMNEKALGGAEGEGEGEGEGEPPARQLVERKLFGTLPVENRFLDPLFTLTSSGWYAIAADFQDYGIVYMRPVATPTETRALELAGGADNRNGVLLIGTYKSGRTPQTVSIWVGRDAEQPALEDVQASVTGLFVDGGEQAIDLEVDTATEQRIGDTLWVQMSVSLDEGPIGWATLYVESTGDDGVLVAGPLAIDAAAAGSNALVRTGEKRSLTERERMALLVLKDRSRDQLHKPAGRVSIR